MEGVNVIERGCSSGLAWTRYFADLYQDYHLYYYITNCRGNGT